MSVGLEIHLADLWMVSTAVSDEELWLALRLKLVPQVFLFLFRVIVNIALLFRRLGPVP